MMKRNIVFNAGLNWGIDIRGNMNKRVEELSAVLHEIYQKEAHRQNNARHPDPYESLSENVKEFDRVLARYILKRENNLLKMLKKFGSHSQGCKVFSRDIHDDKCTCGYQKALEF